MAELTGFQRRGSRVWLMAPIDSRISRRALDAMLDTVDAIYQRHLPA